MTRQAAAPLRYSPNRQAGERRTTSSGFVYGRGAIPQQRVGRPELAHRQTARGRMYPSWRRDRGMVDEAIEKRALALENLHACGRQIEPGSAVDLWKRLRLSAL